MAGLRFTPKDLAGLGAAARRQVRKPADEVQAIYLPDLPGAGFLDQPSEHAFQAAAVAHYRRALPQVSDMIALPNQGMPAKMSPQLRGYALGKLRDEGVRGGALDTLPEWDPRLGRPGNLGMCWMEFKRAIDPEAVSRSQVEFMFWRRSMGRVAGWVQCMEHCEALLDEAGAPPRAFSPPLRADMPPWWAALGAEPPLYCDPPWVIGAVRLANGKLLRLGRPT